MAGLADRERLHQFRNRGFARCESSEDGSSRRVGQCRKGSVESARFVNHHVLI